MAKSVHCNRPPVMLGCLFYLHACWEQIKAIHPNNFQKRATGHLRFGMLAFYVFLKCFMSGVLHSRSD